MKLVLAIFVVLVVATLTSGSANADALLDAMRDQHQEKIDFLRGQIAWSRVIAGFAIAIGVLGIVVSAIQTYRNQAVRITTAVFGVTIGALTYTTNVVFDADHRTYKHRIHLATGLLEQIELMLANPGPMDTYERRESFRAKFSEKLNQVNDLFDFSGFDREPPGWQNGGMSLVPTAYAQGISVEETPHIGRSKEGLYFLGVGESIDLNRAGEWSQDSARLHARNYLRSALLKVDGTDERLVYLLVSYLLRTGQYSNEYFQFDEETLQYRFFVQLRVPRGRIGGDLQFFEIENGVALPEGVEQTLRSLKSPPTEYFFRRTDSLAAALREARSRMSAEDYTELLEAVELRKARRYPEARDALKTIVEAYPDSYVAYYNLALSYAGTDEIEHALAAYQRAIELEPKQESRDASIYNNYGVFLLEQRRNVEAVELFERSLSVDPGHPLARRNLALARSLAGPPDVSAPPPSEGPLATATVGSGQDPGQTEERVRVDEAAPRTVDGPLAVEHKPRLDPASYSTSGPTATKEAARFEMSNSGRAVGEAGEDSFGPERADESGEADDPIVPVATLAEPARLSAEIERADLRELEQLAQRQGVSIGEIVRAAVGAYLAEQRGRISTTTP